MGKSHEDPRHKNRQSPPSAVQTPAELSREVQKAHAKLAENEKRIQELEKIVNDKNRWNNTVRGWIGSKISILLVNGGEITGTLTCVDRYTLEVEGEFAPNIDTIRPIVMARPIVIHKGAIVTISQAK